MKAKKLTEEENRPNASDVKGDVQIFEATVWPINKNLGSKTVII